LAEEEDRRRHGKVVTGGILQVEGDQRRAVKLLEVVARPEVSVDGGLLAEEEAAGDEAFPGVVAGDSSSRTTT
jgi:hypothetical protein